MTRRGRKVKASRGDRWRLIGRLPFGRSIPGEDARGYAVEDVAPIAAVRAELLSRIAAIDAVAACARAGDLAGQVDAIRAIALRHGMQPAVTVAHMIESVLARGEHGALVRGWLGVLAEAVGCERHDAAASDAFAAACSVRLAH